MDGNYIYKETNTLIQQNTTMPVAEPAPASVVEPASTSAPVQPTYKTAPVYAPSQATPGKGMGIVSMVLGIIALLITLISCCLPFMLLLSGVLGLLSIVFGIIAIAKKRGKGMGIAGIICSVVGLLAAILIIVFTIMIGAGLVAAPAFMMDVMEEYDLEGYDYNYDYDYDYDDYYYEDDYEDYDYDDYLDYENIDWDEVEDVLDEWSSMIEKENNGN